MTGMNSLAYTGITQPGLYLLLIAAIASIPFVFFLLSIPYAHDLPDHLAMSAQFLTGLSEGSYFPRWYGDFNYGWGEPTGIFYPPGLPASSALLTWVFSGNQILGLVAALYIFTFVGSLGLFRLVSNISTEKTAVVAVVIWIFAPFRAFELYAAGLYSFYAAGCLLPWAILFLGRLVRLQEPGALQVIVGWSVIYASIILTNLPFALMITYLIAAWVIIEIIYRKNIKGAFYIASGGLIGLCLAAAYIFPSVLEIQNIIIPHSGNKPIFESNFIFQSSGSWMPESLKRIFDNIGIYQIMVLALGAVLILVFKPSGDNAKTISQKSVYTLIFTMGLLSFLMSTVISAPLWRHLPLLHQVNLPWRFLEIMTIPMAVSLAIAIKYSMQKSFQLQPHVNVSTILRALIFFAVAVTFTINAYQSFMVYKMNARLTSSYSDAESIQKIIKSFYQSKSFFLPKDAKEPMLLANHPPLKSNNPDTLAKIIEWSSTERRFNLNTPRETKITLRTYYYPGWKGEYIHNSVSSPIDLKANPDTGGILLTAPAGDGEIHIFFATTLIRSIGIFVSCLTIATCFFIIVMGMKRRKYFI